MTDDLSQPALRWEAVVSLAAAVAFCLISPMMSGRGVITLCAILGAGIGFGISGVRRGFSTSRKLAALGLLLNLALAIYGIVETYRWR